MPPRNGEFRTLEDALQGAGVPHQPRNARGWVHVDCVWCGKGDHLGLHAETGVAKCYVCGVHPKIPTLSRVLRVGEAEAAHVLELFQHRGTRAGFRGGGRATPAGVYIPPCGLLGGALTPPHIQYLEERGLDVGELLNTWGVGSVGPLGGSVANRVFIPTVFGGEEVSWQARTIFRDVRPKYLSASPAQERIPHKSIVYGWDHAEREGWAVVVEGAVDVWKLGPPAVHTFGVQWTWAQVELLSRLTRVVVMYDREDDRGLAEGVERQARTLAEALAVLGVDAEVANLPVGVHDAGELPLDEARGLMKELSHAQRQQ